MPKPQPSKMLKANHTFVHVHRQLLGDKGKNIWIISKIENQQGIKNLTEIIKTSDSNRVICVMMLGETDKGDYPAVCVKAITKIAIEVY